MWTCPHVAVGVPYLLLAVGWSELLVMTFLGHTHLLVNAMEFGYLYQRQSAKAPTSPWKYTVHARVQRGKGGGSGSRPPSAGPEKSQSYMVS